MSTPTPTTLVLPGHTWRERARAHADRADAMTAGWRARKQTHTAHPVEDFLFTYYPTRPAQLRRWHPGAGIALQDAAEFTDRKSVV